MILQIDDAEMTDNKSNPSSPMPVKGKKLSVTRAKKLGSAIKKRGDQEMSVE
jgi:hypothetical protein